MCYNDGKGLAAFQWWAGHYPLSVDGIGYFYSEQAHCEQCREKRHRDGRVSWYHPFIGGRRWRLPRAVGCGRLASAPIQREDGLRKDDCERHAAKRLLADVRWGHPHVKLIVVEDALAANGPPIRLLQSLKVRYLLGVKPGDHGVLFDWVAPTPGVATTAVTEQDGTAHRFRYLNEASLNDRHFDVEVNFLTYEEHRPSGPVQRFTWVTDLPLPRDNLVRVLRGARARWRIEHETFNTLKRHGDHFAYNVGHGYQHRSTVLAYLVMLAFLIDQVQQHCCGLFQAARAKPGRQRYFWEKLRRFFFTWLLPDWEALYRARAYGAAPTVLTPYDTS